jgi:hypothetical protein
MDMETTPALKVVIAYETLDAALRAKEMSERLKAELNSSCEVWSMESLAHLPLRQLAATAASEADIVVIAARNAQALPLHLKDWIEDWLVRKKPGPTALVALYDEEQEAPRETPQGSPSLGTYLDLIAERGGMDFFSNTGDGRLPHFQNTKNIHPHRAQNECAEAAQQDSLLRGWVSHHPVARTNR